jgi:basic membrane protein A
VPFEQQWAGRLHKALKAAEARGEIEYKASENVSNADYERVMREYATGGNAADRRRGICRRGGRAQGRQGLPQGVLPDGLLGKPQAPNFSVFDNYIQEPAYLSAWSPAA